MENYKLTVQGGLTIIEHVLCAFKMSVHRDYKAVPGNNTALLEATLYREDGVFVKNGSYHFEALDKENHPLIEVNIDDFKTAVDFFFTSILNTHHYVKSIPKASSLCNSEMKRFQFEKL